MKLTKVTIHKFKCIENDQVIDIKDDITILVGMNESGKTAVLQSIAKTNYFQNDAEFKFNLTHDYPRKWKKSIDKLGENPKAITCEYEISDSLVSTIEQELGKGVIKGRKVVKTTMYDNDVQISLFDYNRDIFLSNFLKSNDVYSDTLLIKISKITDKEALNQIIEEYKDEKYKLAFKKFEKYLENIRKFDNPIDEYLFRTYLEPNFPKFLYYDEYYSLPSRVSLEKIQQNDIKEEQDKTAKALIELADINLEELIHAKDFESYKAELEATQAIISEVLFKYWKTNRNLNIDFDIDKIEDTDDRNNTRIVEHVLDIRVRNKGVTLPLKNRSRGFNWFFSFLVWFKKIQEDRNSKYILLLDEPGLNLHASAQKDLLNFLEDLSKDYQIIYTTHSPFMIPTEKLDRVRTVLETDSGTKISESIQEKDPNTLFPLQAALGYDIAQNLFISPKNLLVEGASDLIYLQFMSNLLESNGKIGLRDDITIVPVGGLDKVATFISLLRGQELEIVCLLDSFKDPKGKAKLDDLVIEKIIKENRIIFFDNFIQGYNQADLEDMFSKNDYLKIYNQAFATSIKLEDLNSSIKPIIIQINKYLDRERFNHYKPANCLIQLNIGIDAFEQETIDRFENIFTTVNSKFEIIK